MFLQIQRRVSLTSNLLIEININYYSSSVVILEQGIQRCFLSTFFGQVPLPMLKRFILAKVKLQMFDYWSCQVNVTRLVHVSSLSLNRKAHCKWGLPRERAAFVCQSTANKTTEIRGEYIFEVSILSQQFKPQKVKEYTFFPRDMFVCMTLGAKNTDIWTNYNHNVHHFC